MSIKTLSTANVNIGSKPDFPNGLTVSSGNVGIGTRTASYPLDVQTLGSGVTTAQRLVVNSSYFTFANGTVTVDTAARTGTITITSAEAYTSSLIYTGMILTATGSGGNLGTMAAGTYVTVTGTSVNGSSQLVIAYSYPSGGTNPVAGTVTSVIVSGYVAGWGPSLLLTGGGASVDLASIAGLVGTSNSNTAGDLAFYTRLSGTLAERMRITSSGNVGIGTTSPGAKLDVDGNIIIRGSSGGNSWTNQRLLFAGDGTGYKLSIGSINNAQTINTAVVTIQDNGNVGIGTTSPAQVLHVAGRTLIGGATTNAIWDINADSMGINRNISSGAIYDATGHAYQWQHTKSATAASNTLSLQVYTPAGVGVTGGMTITGAGNVGIATSSPAERLHVNGNVLLDNQNGYYVKNTAGTSCRVGAVDASNQLLIGDGFTTSMYLTAGQNIYFSANGAYRGNINGTNGYWRIGDSTAASVPMDVLVYSTQSTNVLRLTALAKDYTFANGTFSAVSTGAKTIVLTIDSAETTTAAQITASCIGSAIYGTGVGFGSFTAFSALFTVTSATTISNKLVITCTWTGSPTTAPSNGAVTAIFINGYRAGWGPQLLFAGMGDGRDTGAIRVLTETDGGGANAYMAFCTRGLETVPERMRLTSTGRLGIGTTDPSATLHVVGTVAGAVAPRIFIPASAFVPFTSTAPSLSQSNGVYILTFAALDSAYTYIIVPSNYNGTNDIKVGVYGAAGTANALVEYQKNSAPTTSMGTASVTVNSSLTPTLTAWTLLSAQTLPSPGHLMQIKISAPTGKTLTLYGVAISFGE